MTKFYAQEKQVFDINKVTIVGSPTITSDGVLVATNTDYLKSTFTLDKLNGKSWRFICKTYWGGRNNGTYYTINLGDDYCYFRITSTQELVFNGYLASDNSQVYQAKYAPSIFDVAGWYWVEMSFDYNTGTYKGFAGKNKNEMTQLLEIVKGEGEQLRYLDSSHNILFKTNNTTFPYSIDLTAFKIYVDGELVYSPTKPVYFLERRKEGFDSSKFTVVGSPTITEYGVASGFGRTDYCKFSLDQIYKPFRITTKFTTPASFPTTNEAIFSLTLGWSNTYIFQKGTGIFAYFYFTDGTSISDKRYFTIQNSTTYYLALDFTGNKYNLYLSKDRATLYNNTQLVTEGNASPVITQVTIGNHGEGSYPFNGSIDLADFSITVDGKEVFTGAKEKFYAMRGM